MTTPALPVLTPTPTTVPVPSRTNPKNIYELKTTPQIIHAEELNEAYIARYSVFDRDGTSLGLIPYVGPDNRGYTYGWGHHAISNGDTEWCEAQLQTNHEGKKYWSWETCNAVFDKDVAVRENRARTLLTNAGVDESNQNQFDAIMQMLYLGCFGSEGAQFVSQRDRQGWQRRLHDNVPMYHDRLDRGIRMFFDNDTSYYHLEGY